MKAILIIMLLSFSTLNAQFNDEKSDLNNLSRLGAISVTIGGDFIINGSFPAFVTERVDQFVTRVFNQSADVILNAAQNQFEIRNMKRELEKYSLRDITLKRASGEVLRLDLQKFRINGDFVNNPYLKNDDVIIFPQYDIDRNFFTIEGGVNTPGTFFFMEGDNLQDALELAGGINKAYENVKEVNIHRLSYDGKEVEIIKTDILASIPLKIADRIIVIAEDTQRREYSVLVFGEVKRPGKVPITKNNTTLKTVLELAGGFTDDASLKRSKLLKGSNNIRFIIESEFGLNLEEVDEYFRGWPNDLLFKYEANTMFRMSTLTEEDTTFFLVDEQIRQMINDATIDFTKALDENSEVSNIRVDDGDVIIVPPKLRSVYVYGQVGNPGMVNYFEGKDFRYYINGAGGLGDLSQDEEEIIIIKADSKKWISAFENSTDIEPGDYIYVPKSPVRSFNFYVTTISNYLSIVGSIATIAILVVQLGKP